MTGSQFDDDYTPAERARASRKRRRIGMVAAITAAAMLGGSLWGALASLGI